MARALQPTSQTLQRPPVNTPQQQAGQQSTPFQNFSEGFVKGGLSTIRGIGTIGQGFLDSTVNKLGLNAGSDVYRPQTATGQKVSNVLAPQGTAQSVGFGTEKLAEFFAPASKAAKLEQTITDLSAGIGNNALAASTRILGKGLVQGAAAGGVNYIQTGGNAQSALKTGLTAGIARGTLATIGEGARALKIPERLYSTIFKNAKNDMIQELNSNGLMTLKQNNPEKYQEFLNAGIIRETNGQPVLHQTLAEQAIDKGLRGSIRSMADNVLGKTLQAENDVRNITSQYQGTISLPEKQFVNVFKSVAAKYENVGFGEVSKEAQYLSSLLENTGGQVSANDALTIRRFLDKMRIASSFDKSTTDLSTSQANFKTLADAVRGRLAKVPGIAPVMKDYSFYIDAMQALAKEASRRENNQVLSLIDSVFLGGGLGSSNPSPLLTIGVLRRLIQSAPGMTFAGQLLNKGVAAPATIGTISGASAGAQSLLSSQ